MEIRNYAVYKEPEILNLYTSVGWTAYTCDPKTLKMGFSHSLLILAAYEGEKLLGLVRVVGDGFTVVLIQDLLVLPAYQHKGIGGRLVQAVLKRFSHVRQIELATENTPKTIGFYRSQGFLEMSELGCLGFMKP